MKKSFGDNIKQNLLDPFLSEDAPQASEAAEGTEPETLDKAQENDAPNTEIDYQVPKGFHLVPESKNKRLQSLITPSLYNELKSTADREGRSVNDLVNSILKAYFENTKESR